jgi:hypothetical protein
MYKQTVNIKQADMDKEKKHPKEIQKYTSRAYIDEEPRTFQVRATGITMHDEPTPLTQQEGGKVYSPDKKFTECIEAFIQKHPEYDITFYPTSKHGPTFHYCGDGYVCFIQSITGETLFAEDPDAYDCQVM